MFESGADVVVVGAGPAGLAAAVRAAEVGRRVLLVDDGPAPGGQIWRAAGAAAPKHHPSARRWLARAEAAGVESLSETTVFEVEPAVDVAKPRRLLARSPRGLERLTAESVVVATGAVERFLPFPGWTLPGVVGAGGAQALAKSGWRVAGKRVAVAGSGPLLLAVAAELRRRGAQMVEIAEQAPLGRLLGFTAGLAGHPRKLAQLLGLAASLGTTPRHFGCWPVAAVGEERLEGVVLRDASGAERMLSCDVLACGFGLVPEVRLAALLGCAIEAGRVVVDDLQATDVEGVWAAGEPTGIGGVDLAIVEGEIAGLAAAGAPERASALQLRRQAESRFADRLERAFALRPELCAAVVAETIVCRCEDVPWSRLAGAGSWREAKLRSRCGMGPCQGRVCGPALEFLRGWPAEKPRPPLFPVPLGLLAELALETNNPSPSEVSR